MTYYLEPDGHIRDKVKVVLNLSNYATKKESDHATGVDTFDLKAEVVKLGINKFGNVPTCLKKIKTKVHGVDAGHL